MPKGGKREGAGRKPLAEKTRLVSFDINDEDWRLFQEICGEENTSCAESLRTYVAIKIAKRKAKTNIR